jgi:hypothetical protein
MNILGARGSKLLHVCNVNNQNNLSNYVSLNTSFLKVQHCTYGKDDLNHS